ncbi:hemolysin family protein [Polyangium jinanense]|uniref:HlyC/CorC family transporter n=1 Tax=Polyangium jinanense TaxID=2829994 RepID=A0A9X3X5S2_9BACT|nr:hemolysin family protein [Polyangium jinanense]MDC3954294.1 HlyC/CorC family transporter [Polyangium jinanense]MDC3984254.1 HlyC/CorC family transporter [Polyangium jinanense]
MSTILYLLATALLILLNAFFVASEFAIVKMRPSRLEQLVRSGDARAKRALTMSQRLDAYLSANQLGITLASLGLGWIGEPAVAHLLEPALLRFGVGPEATRAIALGVAFTLIMSLHTIIGELAPKTLAIQRTEKVTLFAAQPLHVFFVLMWPIIWVLNSAANGFVRLFGLQPAHEEEIAHTSEELRILLTRSPAGLDPALRSMLVRIFDLRRRTARHVMSLRSEAATLRAAMSIDEAVKIVAEAGYSRYPVLDAQGHTVLGYLHLRDLFDVLSGRRKAARVAELLRKPIFARETTSVERLRLEMQAKQIPVAIVTSPTGEFVGLVTIEDVLEEIVGEIRDENDEEVPPIHRRGPGIVEVDGRVLLADLERDAGIVLLPEAKTVETVGGYILERLEHPAEPGDRVECEGYTLVVTDVVGRRVRRVRIVTTDKSVPPPPPSAAEADGGVLPD